MSVLFCAGCGRSGSQTEKTQPQKSADSASEAKAADGKAADKQSNAVDELNEARALLKAMAAAYAQASSYQDAAEVEIRGTVDGRPFSEKGDYSLTLERPNKLRMHVYQGTAVCNGRNLLAWVAGIPNQVLKVPAPDVVGIDTIFANNVLADSMANGPTQHFAWAPLQMILLCGEDPLGTLLFRAKEARLLEPADIDGQKCVRVQLRRTDGTCVFWIERRSHILRRFEFPVEQFSGAAGEKKIEVQSLSADFRAARLNEKIGPTAFQTELPPEADFVEELAPIAVQMLGKTAPDFIFTDLDNKPLTLKSLAGTIALIEFWSVSCLPCRDALLQLEKVYQKFKNNPKTAFLAVSIDPGGITSERLAQACKEMGISVPVYRISQQDADRALKIRGIPTTVILGPDGRVQDYQPGMAPEAAALINQEIELLLAGKDVAAETMHTFETIKLRYAELFQAMQSRNLYVNPAIIAERMAVAKKTSPKLLKLEPLWTCAELADASGILVIPPDGGKAEGAKILALHGGRSAAALDAGGNIIADHDLKLPEREYVSRLRTFKGKDGKRLFLTFAPGMQQVHLFDADWRHLMSFPSDARENPHAGVGDAWIADFDGNAVAEIAVGYLGLVGVKGVSLEGKSLWSNRRVANVFSMAVGEADKSGQRTLYCVNDRAALAAIDPRGKIQQELSLDGRLLFAVAAANLDNEAAAELCGLSAPSLGENLAVGIDPQGNLLWRYDMPQGTFAETIERICGARLSKQTAGQWILLGPDGSVHIVGIGGKPVDQFNYGAAVTGLAAGELSGRPVLIFASRQGVEALTVELPEVYDYPAVQKR